MQKLLGSYVPKLHVGGVWQPLLIVINTFWATTNSRGLLKFDEKGPT